MRVELRLSDEARHPLDAGLLFGLDTMIEGFASVWYAKPERAMSMTKFIVFSDRGSFAVLPGEIQFVGNTVIISMRKILAVSLTSQRIPLLSYAIMNITLVGLHALVSAEKLRLRWMTTMAVLNLLALSIGLCQKWVRVEYEDESNQSQTAYFADGSSYGWGCFFGGTARLCHAIGQHADTSN